MRWWREWALVATAAVVLLGSAIMLGRRGPPKTPPAVREQGGSILLPSPRHDGPLSVEAALILRRSVRSYSGPPLSLEEASQLLWAAQGVTASQGYRTAPSAGALYPLELYLVAGEVAGLAAGVYHYLPVEHALSLQSQGDQRVALAAAAVGQTFIQQAPASLVFTAIYERTSAKYGGRGRQYVHMEIGHAGQNVYLQAQSLGLGTVAVGAFHDDGVREVLSIPKQEVPLYIMPVGAQSID